MLHTNLTDSWKRPTRGYVNLQSLPTSCCYDITIPRRSRLISRSKLSYHKAPQITVQQTNKTQSEEHMGENRLRHDGNDNTYDTLLQRPSVFILRRSR